MADAPHTSEYCLARAQQCEEQAEKTRSDANKALLLELAKRWRALAVESEQASFHHRIGRRIGRPSPE